jgi:TRAP-type uncharacterized transport system fused permease subunit
VTFIRRLTIVLATLLLALMLYIVNMGVWVNRNVLDTETFVETAVSSLQVESSREAVARIIVDRLAEDSFLVLLIEGPLVSLFTELLDSPRFEVVLVTVGERLHAQVIEGGGEAIDVELGVIESLVRNPLRVLAPDLEASIPGGFFDSVTIVEEGRLPDASPYVAIARAMTIAATVVALALVVMIISLTRPARFSLVALGIAVALSGLATSWLVPGGRSLTIEAADDPNIEILIANLYDALAVSLKSQSRAVLAIGLLMVVAGVVFAVVKMRDSGSVGPVS